MSAPLPGRGVGLGFLPAGVGPGSRSSTHAQPHTLCAGLSPEAAERPARPACFLFSRAWGAREAGPAPRVARAPRAPRGKGTW